MAQIKLQEETIQAIEQLLNKDKTIEIKRERDSVVVIGIDRKVAIKTPIEK